MKVVLLADQGESFAEIAKFLFIDEQTTRRRLKDYFDNDKTGGSSGGSGGKLSQEQAVRLRAILATCDVPTAKAVVEKVKALFGITFSISGMTDWLERNRFSFKKSQPAPAKADPQAQTEFIDKYRDLKDGLPDGEVILFLDAMHPTMATKLGYGWSVKGSRKIVATTPARARLNVIGTLNAQTLKLVTTFPVTVSSNSQLRDLGGTFRPVAPGLSSHPVFYAQHHPGSRLLLRQQGHTDRRGASEYQTVAPACLFAQPEPDRAGLEGDERAGA